MIKKKRTNIAVRAIIFPFWEENRADRHDAKNNNFFKNKKKHTINKNYSNTNYCNCYSNDIK